MNRAAETGWRGTTSNVSMLLDEEAGINRGSLEHHMSSVPLVLRLNIELVSDDRIRSEMKENNIQRVGLQLG